MTRLYLYKLFFTHTHKKNNFQQTLYSQGGLMCCCCNSSFSSVSPTAICWRDGGRILQLVPTQKTCCRSLNLGVSVWRHTQSIIANNAMMLRKQFCDTVGFKGLLGLFCRLIRQKVVLYFITLTYPFLFSCKRKQQNFQHKDTFTAAG